MAAVSIPPSPQQTLSIMSTTQRRVPLSNVPNASNSPYRASTAAAVKRARPQGAAPREAAPYGQPPPAKKQIIEGGGASAELSSTRPPRTPPRPQHLQQTQQLQQQQPSDENAEGRVFTKRAPAAPMTAFDRKLLAVRGDRPARPQGPSQHQGPPAPQKVTTRAEKPPNENLETIRQWQRHYRKVFPHFVFYFESIHEEVRAKCSRQVTSLGAREEKFFSKNVTHVVTTRPIPPEQPVAPTSTDTIEQSSNAGGPPSQQGHIQTINPSLLERTSEAPPSASGNLPPKGKFTFEASMTKKAQGGARNDTAFTVHDENQRKPQPAQPASGDVLLRAREMGMKIWALEKVQRMMTTMFDTETGFQAQHGHNTRSNVPRQGLTRSNREADLSQLLRNERLNGPTDRDPTVATKEMVHFKGPFVYIRDMDEKARPIMIREYTKVSHREDGAWPQFRSVREGKCPFLEDVGHYRAPEKERPRAKMDRPPKLDRENQGLPRTRAAKAAQEAAKMQPPPNTVKRPVVVAEAENLANSGESMGTGLTAPKSKLFEPPMVVPAKRSCPEDVLRPLPNQHVGRGGPALRAFGGEPVASGVQQSNITSAIRSQMISSTAAAPGAKAGTSKEVFELKRKVLEKRNAPSAGNGVPSSHRLIDSAGSVKTQMSNPSTIPPSNWGQGKLVQIDEDASHSDGEHEEQKREVEVPRKLKPTQPKKPEKRDLKPGYCENCRDKFEDFDEHVLSRKHRKFAAMNSNWAELDALLSQLIRPLKEEYLPDL